MKYVDGDLLEMADKGLFDVIAHGQNCFHGWKKGIAKTIAKKYKNAVKSDKETSFGDKEKVGTYSSALVSLENNKTLTILNCYTQYSFGQGDHANYDAIRDIFTKINAEFKNKKVGIPKIGSGQAGGDWKRIEKILEDTTKDLDLTIVVFKE